MLTVAAFVVVALASLIGVGLFIDRRKLPGEPADVALVFGTGLDWKAASRVEAAATAFDRGWARHLIVSGGVLMPGLGGITEAEWFRSRLLDLGFGPGTESLEVRLFDESEIPWETLAFRTIARTLRNFFLDRRHGTFALHVSALERRPPLPPDLLAAG